MTTHKSYSLAKLAEEFPAGKSKCERERLLARKARVRKRRILSAANKWQEWELALLGHSLGLAS